MKILELKILLSEISLMNRFNGIGNSAEKRTSQDCDTATENKPQSKTKAHTHKIRRNNTALRTNWVK